MTDGDLLNHGLCGQRESLAWSTPGIDSQNWAALEEAGKAHPQGIPVFPLPGLSQDTHTTKGRWEVNNGALSGYYLRVSKVNQLAFSFKNPVGFLLKQLIVLTLPITQCIHF